MIELLALPFAACLVLTGIHAYLGLHVLARGVIFVDLALAQIAALGLAGAALAGHPIQSDAAYWYALVFTVAGAAVFALSRLHRGPVPQEAIIGIAYAVSAAAAVLVVDRAPQGTEYIKQLLVGGILTVTPGDVAVIAVLYGAIGLLHWLVREPLLDISFDPDGARRRRRAVLAWDFVFYTSFGLVVTSSVRVAGVLVVFAFLIVPAVVGALVARSVLARLLTGWGVGLAGSTAGLVASWAWDLPTGATIVTTFGVLLAAVGLLMAARGLLAHARRRGARAAADLALGAAAVLGVIGLLLLAFPSMDQPWLEWMEGAMPALRLAFLDAAEREADAESRQAIDEGLAELSRMRRLQEDVQWGRRAMSDDMRERLRQYIAGRAELVAGDRLVRRALTARARGRQRWALGVPLLLAGFGLGLLAVRRRRPAKPAAGGLSGEMRAGL